MGGEGISLIHSPVAGLLDCTDLQSKESCKGMKDPAGNARECL